MEAVIDVRNPIAVRRAGERVLMDTLGPEVTQAFLKNVRRRGDYTAEKQEQPDATAEDIETYGAELMRLDAERRAEGNVWK